MSRFRLLPTSEHEAALLAHCRDARYVWNLALEQQQHWQPGRNAPGYLEQAAQLTEARAGYAWLRAGSQTVQQQALQDFAQAMRNLVNGTHRRPTWRKAGVQGFGRWRKVITLRLNHRFGRRVPKVGGQFRLSRSVPGVLSSGYAIALAAACRVRACPRPDLRPNDGSVVGIDRLPCCGAVYR